MLLETSVNGVPLKVIDEDRHVTINIHATHTEIKVSDYEVKEVEVDEFIEREL